MHDEIGNQRQSTPGGGHSRSRPETAARSRATRTWRCPPDEQLAAFAGQRLDRKAHGRVQGHVAGCDSCLAQVAFLLEVAGVEPAALPPGLAERVSQIPSRKQPAWAAWWKPATAAATACLVVALAVGLRNPAPEPAPDAPPAASVPARPASAAPSPSAAPEAPAVPPRAAPPSRDVRATRSGPQPDLPRMIAPAAGASVPRDAVVLEWTNVRRAIYYEASIVTADGDLFWKGRAEAGTHRVSVPAPLAAGGRYFAWVRAYLPEGKTFQTKAVEFAVE